MVGTGKETTKETVEARDFDRKFKNYLRDCYTYGFKDSTDFPKSVDVDWPLLNNVLRNYVEWSDTEDKKDKKEVMYITQDSETLGINPFHRVYRFCPHRDQFPSYFFHSIATLSSPRISLRSGVDTLNAGAETREQIMNEIDKRDRDLLRAIDRACSKITKKGRNLDKDLEDLNSEIFKDNLFYKFDEDFNDFERILREEGLNDDDIGVFREIKKREYNYTLKTSQLVSYYQNQFLASSDPSKTLKTPLENFKEMGILKLEKSDNNKLADNRWSLSPLTMERLINAGASANSEFEQHFQYFLDFFSKYYMFGELGTFLLDRIQSADFSSFRFKHEYFMQSLNDFNVIDLIHAIEEKKWCYITYSHGTEECEMKLLCLLLEIRVSSVTGREFVMYYEPIHRSYSALRIEFIDSIDYYDDDHIRKVLDDVLALTSEELESDIKNARWALEHTWGVSTPGALNGNAKNKVPLTSVNLKIHYDAKKESYISDRLYRERRRGSVTKIGNSILQYTGEVTDAAELRPWIRSFYSRIDECEGLDTEQYSVKLDVDRMVAASKKEMIDKPDLQSRTHQPAWDTLDEIMNKAGKGEKAREHEKLFNVVFSVYYYMLANTFNRLCSDDQLANPSKEKLEESIRQDLEEEKKDPLRSLEQEVGAESEVYLSEKLEKYFIKDGYIYEPNENVEDYGFEFIYSDKKDYMSVDFYRELVPLTVLEIRWLKTVLVDERAKYFLNNEEIRSAKEILDELSPDTSPFPMDKVVYHDQYIFPDKDIQVERDVINEFLDGISKKRILEITYTSNEDGQLQGEYIPGYLEFSQRKRHFRAYCIDFKTRDVVAINLASVLHVEKKQQLDEEDEKAKKGINVEMLINEYREQRYETVTIRFYDKFNLADRILTEFSPWKKTCRYDKETELYTLTISYPEDDERELVMRLLGYGADIFIDQSQTIDQEIKRRVEKQQKLYEGN